MSLPDKQKIVDAIVAQLQSELTETLRSAAAAREAATHSESRAEDSHDTRGLEASYLAGAQTGRAEALKTLIAAYAFFPVRDYADDEAIGIGATIELDLEGKRSFCFLVAQGGGYSLSVDGVAIQVLTSQAPLGEALLGRKVGDYVELQTPSALREYEVIRVR